MELWPALNRVLPMVLVRLDLAGGNLRESGELVMEVGLRDVHVALGEVPERPGVHKVGSLLARQLALGLQRHYEGGPLA